jgi:class 3 adenylate cyclase/tetratricopeptide (TPR) repeat protein
VTCGTCGADNPATGKFCAECGSPLMIACPTCGTPAGSAQKFCGECGTRLDRRPDATPGQRATVQADPVPADRGSSSVAERRVCSVLFADLVGFTPLSESRDPEDVRELLSSYFKLARTVIGRYGGVVEKFIGDAVMAIWGTPVAGEDDAERAVRAGLELVTAIAALGDEAELPDLLARVGVVTGEVAVTLSAVGQGMAAGDAVNTAARVQSAASPGQVWVDETTHRLAAAAIAFTDCGEHSLKGKSRAVRLWVATRVLAGVRGEQRVDGLEAPLVGRDAELRVIKDLFHATIDRRTPRLVVVSGPAGVGKSRLGWEFEKYIDGLAQVMWWHRGRCLSYGDGVVFWALAQIVRQRLGIAEEDSVEVAAIKLEATLGNHLPDPTERTFVAIRLGRLLGVPVAADTGSSLAQAELFAGWRLFFERLASDQPVVMLIEDLQYADAGLLAFLDHLIDWARDVPIFVLAFTRPELEHTRPGWATGRNRTALTLDPLDSRAMDELVDALVPAMPEDARKLITAQAQGIPLFAVETIRSLIDRDIVIPRDGVYQLVGDIDTLAVPEGLHALLAARIDALDPDLRALVADAAVLGASFPADALMAISGQQESAVRAGLAELLRREVLEVSADKLSPERGSYRFAQNLLGRVAYRTLARRDRKARHLAVAGHLRATFAGDGDEVIDAIARHYRDALEAAPDDPDVEHIRSEAVDALVRGAQRALRSGAPRAASVNYATAARLIDGRPGEDIEPSAAESAPHTTSRNAPEPTTSPRAAPLWEAAAQADDIAGDHDAMLRHADRAIAGHAAAGLTRDGARARGMVGRALSRSGRQAEAAPWFTAAAQVLRTDPDADTVVILNALAVNAMALAPGDAEALSSEALQLGEALEVDDALLSRLFNTRGTVLATEDRIPEAIAALEFAAGLAERAGASMEAVVALANLADINLNRNPKIAADNARRACEHSRRIGARQRLALSVFNLASALTLTGEWDAADAAITTAAESDGVDDVDYLDLGRGLLAALRGEVETSRRLAALPRLRSSDEPENLAMVALLDALIADAQGDPVNALTHARSALTHTRAIGLSSEGVVRSWPIAVHAAHTLGDVGTVESLVAMLDDHPVGHLPVLLRVGRELARARLAAGAGDESADRSFIAATTTLRRFGSPYHLAVGLLDHAEYLARVDNLARAGDLLAEATGLAETLGARPLLERAHALARLTDLPAIPSAAASGERRSADTPAGRSAAASFP